MIKNCAKENSVPAEQMMNSAMLNGNQKCAYHCVTMQFQAMDKDGKITKEAHQKFLEQLKAPPTALAAFDACVAGLKATAPCEKAEELFVCMHKK